MVVPHLSVTIVARGSGRSAVLSAAYRHCAKMDYEREARTIDYTRKQGLLHEEFNFPVEAPEWLRRMVADRSVAQAHRRRKPSGTAWKTSRSDRMRSSPRM